LHYISKFVKIHAFHRIYFIFKLRLAERELFYRGLAVRLPQFVMLSQIVRLPHLVKEPILGVSLSIPHLRSQPRQAPLFIFATLHLVPHSWVNGSAGVPAVPATISMSAKG
jgi:hypothetical protein